MRVNLIAQANGSPYGSGSISLTVKPACGIPGDFLYSTDRITLLRMLRRKTELRSGVLERFEQELSIARQARILAVELSEETLTEIGYFVD